MDKKYKTMDEKIKRIIQTQTYAPRNDMSFYPRVVNETDIINMLVVLTETYCNKVNIHIKQRDDFIQITLNTSSSTVSVILRIILIMFTSFICHRLYVIYTIYEPIRTFGDDRLEFDIRDVDDSVCYFLT